MNYELLRVCDQLRKEINFLISLYPVVDDYTGESEIVTIKKTLEGIITDIIFNGVGCETEGQIERCKIALSKFNA